MARPVQPQAQHRFRTRLAGLLAATGLAAGTLVATAAPAHAENPVTPGNFTGYGFDQCLAPTQKAMNAWLNHSPFLAVGIYISGESRACRSQPNLTPTWVGKQLRKGWRLLPITLGPQASCSDRFPRYGHDETINPKPGSRSKYKPARRQARAEADEAVATAQRLGIVKGSTLWYDLEAFDTSITHCRESALAFLSAWTTRLHALDYVSGVYSSAGSGIKMLDDARVNRPGRFAMPDQVWIARWSGVPGQINDASNTYIRNDGWVPHARVHQYRGDHDETWGGVRINIDSNWLDLGRGSVAAPEKHCGGVDVDMRRYRPVLPKETSEPRERVKVLQCLLSEAGKYGGKLSGVYNDRTIEAVQAWQAGHGFPVSEVWSRENWMSLHVAGARPVVKLGSAGADVHDLQRALNAAGRARLAVDGVLGEKTDEALRAYQRSVGITGSGVAQRQTWKALRAGVR
ncbi:glycoside hydrolase domain-containing protein [Nocardioides sp. GCM10027113]|uniref:glycoside hydrolase domain-containing protein n=1 Tax=unclassified Nocardioides TaxID=2615069 RepID=UPI0036188A8A